MKNLVCAIGLVVLCLLKATLVWSLCCCVGGALAILGTGVLGLAQPRGPGGVTVAVVKKEKPTSKSASFYLSVRGEGRNRTRSSPTVSLNTLIYKAILTPILQGFKRFLALSATCRT